MSLEVLDKYSEFLFIFSAIGISLVIFYLVTSPSAKFGANMNLSYNVLITGAGVTPHIKVAYNHSIVQNKVLSELAVANQDAQTLLLIVTTLIGLYAILFVEILKDLDRKKNAKSKLRYARYLLVLLAIIPLIVLFGCLQNIFYATDSFSIVGQQTAEYLAVENVTPTNTIAILNYTANSGTTFNITLNYLEKQVTGTFDSLKNNVYDNLWIAIDAIFMNLFFYWGYLALLKTKSKEEEHKQNEAEQKIEEKTNI